MSDLSYLKLGFNYNPFIKNSNKFIVETKEMKEVKIRLDFLFETKGIGLVTGDPGLGKTTIIRDYVSKLNSNFYKVIYCPISTVTVNEFYRYISEELGNETKYKKTDNFKAIQERIEALTTGKKITPVIIIDEAHLLRSSTIQDLKILFNFNMDSVDKCILILCGHSNLNSMLSLHTFEDLNQRIITRINIERMSEAESINYIEQKVTKAGSNMKIFADGTVKAIVSLSNGIPRLIDNIINNCFLIMDKKKLEVITTEVVDFARSEIK